MKKVELLLAAALAAVFFSLGYAFLFDGSEPISSFIEE
jgi:hypothetical protein